jgi:hypothetical protein
MKPSEIAELFVELQDESDFPNWHEPRSTLARAYLRLREAALKIKVEDDNYYRGPRTGEMWDEFRAALEETEE